MERFRVLVVDDETAFLDTMVTRLKMRTLDVTGVGSGEKAIELLESHHFDVVILDLDMPRMDGVETLREMKRLRPLMEVIVLTGHASAESGIAAMKLGAFNYVVKPADLDDLVEEMRAAYAKKAALTPASAHENKCHPGAD